MVLMQQGSHAPKLPMKRRIRFVSIGVYFNQFIVVLGNLTMLHRKLELTDEWSSWKRRALPL